MQRQRIGNMDQLEKEIYRRKLRAREIEHALERNFDHLRDNYGGMALRSLTGALTARGGTAAIATGIAVQLLKSEKLQGGLTRLLDNVTAWIGAKLSGTGRKSAAPRKKPA